MNRILEEGERVRARVAGFLPGRRVMLDLEGETVLAVSDLPLVRGRRITARAEKAGAALRLRVLPEGEEGRPSGPGSAPPAAGCSPDGLDRAIAVSAGAEGIPATRELLDRVRREMIRTDPDLAKGKVISLEDAARAGARIVAAFARGLEPTARVLAALGAGDGEARLGIALDRLVRSLREAAESIGAAGGCRIVRWAEEAERYFLDLGERPLAGELGRAILRSGFAFEEKLAGRGAEGWTEGEAFLVEGGEDLKGFLMALHGRLLSLRNGPLPRERRDEMYRALERALAWTARSLDRIESFQIANLPGPEGAVAAPAYQIPVRYRGAPGTLHLFFSDRTLRCWLEGIGDGPVGWEAGGDPPVLRRIAVPSEQEESGGASPLDLEI